MAETFSFAGLGLAPGEIAFCLAVVLAGGFMRGFTGFGFAMAAVPLLAQAIPPIQAVPFVILLQLFAALWDWRDSRRKAHWRSLPWLIAGALIGTPIGTAALALMSADWARLVIAVAVGAAVLALARGLRLGAMPRRPILAGTGFMAGLLNGLAAMPGPPVIVLYLAGPVAVEIGRASLLMFFSLTNVAGAASAGAAGLLNWGTVALAAAALPLLLLAQWAGRRAFARSSERRFRQVAILFLAALAALTAIRAAMSLLQVG